MMSYILESSLQIRTLVKISSILWNQSDIRTLIAEYKFNAAWEVIEEKVVEKVEKLSQTKVLKEKISGFVRPMGQQIYIWKMSELSSNCGRRDFLQLHTLPVFSWTSYGTIDRRKTAKMFIDDQTVDVDTHIKLALIYCLEEESQKIWDKMPEDQKYAMYKTKDNPGIINEMELLTFWTTMDEMSWQAGPSYEYAFLSAVENDNKPAAEYFFKKLTPIQKARCLESGVYNSDGEMLYFIFSQLNEKQRTRLFQTNALSFMQKFFDWPWLRFYVEIANRFWDSPSKPKDNVSPLIALISSKAKNGFENGIYLKLFTELWKCICKRFGADVCVDQFLLAHLFSIRDKKNIRLIFQNASAAVKKEFILSNDGLYMSIQLMKKNERELLEIFIQECLSSKFDIIEYEKKLKEFATITHPKENLDRMISAFFMLGIDCENKEKKYVEGKENNSVN